MITRNPAAAIRAAEPNLIQLTSALENSPWSRMTGRPSPVSCHASSTPSEAVQRWIATSVTRETQRMQQAYAYAREANGTTSCPNVPKVRGDGAVLTDSDGGPAAFE